MLALISITDTFELSLNENSEIFLKIGIALSAILLALAMLRVADDYINANNSGIMSLIKPIFIFLCVCLYPSICGAFKSTVNVFTREIVEQVDYDVADYIDAVQSTIGSFEEQNKEAVKRSWKNVTGITSFIMFLKDVVGSVFSYAGNGVLGILSYLIFLLSKVAIFVIQVISSVYLLLLETFGIFAFALSTLHAFEGTIKNWIARYIQIALWSPLCFILINLGTKLMLNLSHISTANYSMSFPLICLCAQVVILGAFFSIPRICAWFIDSSGANSAHGSLQSGAAKALKKIFAK